MIPFPDDVCSRFFRGIPDRTKMTEPEDRKDRLESLARVDSVKLSVLVVNYNSGTLLSECLRSVMNTVETAPFEVLIVDNDSSDDSLETAIEEFPDVQYIRNDFNNWYTGGANQAMKACRGDYMLILNPDTVCHPGAVDGLVDFMDDRDKAGIACPKLLNGDGSLQPSCRKFLKSRFLVLKHLLPWSILPQSWKKRFVLEYWHHGETIAADWIIGASVLVRREAVEQVGLKDEEFRMFHEETDWCMRMAKQGWQVWFVHDSVVTHHGSQSAMAMWGDDLVLEFYRGKHMFIRKHFGIAALLIHRVLLAGLLTLRLLAVSFRRIAGGNGNLRRRSSFLKKAIFIQLGLGGKR
ncbi:MAG: glycosyltransferase [Candidatus Aegiribacteria sp.]|nr:glycosyltransferase [Candidatus Aegiribacteria sp.]MBD3294919.1 glycosyltransferase [Candidatus Fermentibacteria bacterium]